MADPKYDNLYGIARDQPDVYETNDLPEADQFEEIYVEESEAIERVRISAPEAFAKFQGKIVDGSKVDFSDGIGRKKGTGYEVGSWELAGLGEEETPLQKYNRLKLEIEQFVEEVSTISQQTKDDLTNVSNNIEISVTASQELFSRLVELRLEDKIGLDYGRRIEHVEGQQFSEVISHLDGLCKDLAKNCPEESENSSISTENVVKLALNFNPSIHVQLTSRLTDLEQKLSKLETLVGENKNQPIRLYNVNPAEGLINCCQWMMAKLTLLDSTQLDTLESKLSNVNSRLEQCLNAQNSLIQDPEKEKKINELYAISEKARSNSELIHTVIERLIAMESMHKQGKQTVQMISHLEALQADLSASLSHNKTLLVSVKQNLNDSFSAIKNNVESLKNRVEALIIAKK